MILGVGLIPVLRLEGRGLSRSSPARFGILASIIVGVMVVRTEEHEDPMDALNIGYYLTSFLSGGWVSRRGMVDAAPPRAAARNAVDLLHACGFIGILTAQAFVYITQYYTEYKYRPVQYIAEASKTGPATNIIAGIAVGLECTAVPVIIDRSRSWPPISWASWPSAGRVAGGLFGTAVATMGMLGTAAYILAMDTFGPITDNAGGIVEMSHQPEEIRKKTDRLDAVGNTTKALTKGYAIGSAALAAFLLFSAYLDEIFNYTGARIGVDLVQARGVRRRHAGRDAGLPLLLAGHPRGRRGGADRHQRGAPPVQGEARHHEGHRGPGLRPVRGHRHHRRAQADDPARHPRRRRAASASSCACSSPEPERPSRPRPWPGLLMVGTIAGILMALFFNNAGGAWDNAKKYIERRHCPERLPGCSWRERTFWARAAAARLPTC